MPMSTRASHVAVSWIWNADGTAGIQRLAEGTELACREFAKQARSCGIRSDETIEIIAIEDLEDISLDRLKGLN